MRKHLPSESVDPRLFWSDVDDALQYVFVTYYVETPFDLRSAAIFMAEEQSLPAGIERRIPVDIRTDERIGKIVDVTPQSTVKEALLPTYWLGEFGPEQEQCLSSAEFNAGEITIAFPAAGFGDNLTHLWSVVFGELPRHGTLSAFKVMDIEFPEAILRAFPGPRFGIEGLRELAGIEDRPLFARSTQPPVGLTTQAQQEIATEVLRGGFDLIKDDELTLNDPLSPFEERVPAMVEHLARLSEECGEKKLYFANIIDAPLKSAERLAQAIQAGVDGVVVGSALQGIEFIREVRERCEVPILAHNACVDIQTRHPRMGVDYALTIKLNRLCGGDLAMLPGAALTAAGDAAELERCLDACLGELGPHKPVMPILAGAKKSDELQDYCEGLQTTDFLLIIATDVDEDAAGQQAGARRFREAWEAMETAEEEAARRQA